VTPPGTATILLVDDGSTAVQRARAALHALGERVVCLTLSELGSEGGGTPWECVLAPARSRELLARCWPGLELAPALPCIWLTTGTPAAGELAVDASADELTGQLRRALRAARAERASTPSLLTLLAEQLCAQVSDAALMVDSALRVVTANAAYAALYGLEAPALRGQTLTDLPLRYYDEQGRALPAEHRPEVRALHGEGTACEYRFESPGRSGWVSIRSSVLLGPAGEPVAVLSLQREVTARRVRAAARQETLYALGQMAAGVAHDLNNALTLILGRTEIAQEALREPHPALDEVSEAVLAIRQAALDAAGTVRRLQDFARERPVSGLAPVDCAELLREAAALTRPRWFNEALRRGASITVEVWTEEVPLIAGVASELRDALTNLIFNAVDALPQGGRIILAVTARAEGVELRVEDTGLGMPEEVRQRALEPYFTTKGEHGGGIGLAMVATVIARHGGKLTLESELGRGTTVRLFLPTTAAAPPPPEPATLPARPGRVLVLDDEPGIAALVEWALRQDRHQVVIQTDPRAAIQQLEHEQFDVVITDLGMPTVSGWEVAAAVKQRSPTTRVVLATGWGGDLEEEHVRRARVDAVPAKPCSFSQLRQVVHRLLAEVPS
jgi:PAS domain S-box-containing protein